MKSKKETFAGLMERFKYHFDLRTVFDDFLTMTICAFGHNPQTKKSYDEDLYMQTIDRYKNSDLRHLFPKMLATLTTEMEQRIGDHMGNDVLGDYYERNLSNKGLSQFFTPWPICEFMAASLTGDDHEHGDPLRVLDPACGSGRTLMCSAKRLGWRHNFYGIDVDHTCVKMAVLNLFLNGVFHAEVMCANALVSGDFRVSYVTSFLPFGIFRITDKERSKFWHMYQSSFATRAKALNVADIKLPSESGDFSEDGPQLTLF